MTILLTQATRIAGIPVAAGTQQTLEASLEADLVARKMATYISDPATALSDVPVTARKTFTGGVELSADGEPITVGGGGITPDATGTLAGRAAHNGAAEGFVYLATDQVPAEYYFRQGVSGWSAAVTVRGPTGATGPQGPQGIQGPPGADGLGGGFALPSTVVTSVANTTTSKLLLVEDGVAEQISVDSLIAAISIPSSGLSAAAALAGSNIITLSQDGGATEVRTTLSALATFFGAAQTTTVPGAPTGVTATAGNTNASVAFSAPSSDGNSAITGYTVTSSPGSFTGTGTASPITVSGLTNGTAYTFTATATNAIGTGAASSASGAVTPSAGATAPAQVTGLTLGTATSTTQPLSWTAPNNGGSAITDYIIQRSPAGENTWVTFADGTSTTASATVTGLTASTSYDYRVAAVNAIGTGTYSTISTGSTASSGTTYTITPYGANAVKTTIDLGAVGIYTDGGANHVKLKLSSELHTAGQYWSISPNPASMLMGWGTSSTVPPAEVSNSQNANSYLSINGMTPSIDYGAGNWSMDSNYLVVVSESGTSTWYFWIKPVDGVAQCMNATTPLVVSNG